MIYENEIIFRKQVKNNSKVNKSIICRMFQIFFIKIMFLDSDDMRRYTASVTQ